MRFGLVDAAELAAGLVDDLAPQQLAQRPRPRQFHGNLPTIQRSGSSPNPNPSSSAFLRSFTVEDSSPPPPGGLRSGFAPRVPGRETRRASRASERGSRRG